MIEQELKALTEAINGLTETLKEQGNRTVQVEDEPVIEKKEPVKEKPKPKPVKEKPKPKPVKEKPKPVEKQGISVDDLRNKACDLRDVLDADSVRELILRFSDTPRLGGIDTDKYQEAFDAFDAAIKAAKA